MSMRMLQMKMATNLDSEPPAGGMQVLLEREDVNPNTPNKNSITPGSIAGWKRDEGMVKNSAVNRAAYRS